MKQIDNDKWGGIAGTVLFHAVLLTVLALGYMYYRYPPEEHPELDNSEILFGGEFVAYEDFGQMETPSSQPESSPQVNETPVLQGEDVVNEGVQGEDVPPLVTRNDESPMKEQEKVNPGPTQEEIEAEKERIRKKEEAETKRKVNKQVAGVFANSQKSQTQSEAKTKVQTPSNGGGTPSVKGLDGYSLSSFGDVGKSSKNGEIRVRVRVNANGEVVWAEISGGYGEARNDATLRNKCRDAALASKFGVPPNTVSEAPGEIVWKFEPKK